jgi:hypothetical protein
MVSHYQPPIDKLLAREQRRVSDLVVSGDIGFIDISTKSNLHGDWFSRDQRLAFVQPIIHLHVWIGINKPSHPSPVGAMCQRVGQLVLDKSHLHLPVIELQ